MNGFLTLLIPAILMLVAVAWGFAIGLGKTRARFICVAVCFVIAMATAFSVKDVSFADVQLAINQAITPDQAPAVAEILEFLAGSPALQQVLTACAGAIVSPLVFLVVFVVLSLVTWAIGAVIFVLSLIFSLLGGRKTKKRRGFLRIAIYAVAQVLLTVFVLMTPIVAYIDCVPAVVSAMDQMGAFGSDPEDANSIGADMILDTVEEINETPLVATYRFLGGDAMCEKLTGFTVGDQETTLAKELGGISSFTANLMTLTKNEIKQYGDTETEAIRNLSECFGDSLLLPTVAGEFIFGITDAWLDESGDGAFIGMEKPKFEDATTKMFAEAFDHILEAFHGDARDVEALCRDFNTLAEIVGILVKDGVFTSMGEESTNALVNKLTSGETQTVKKLITELGNNPSFSVLIGDITNIGMRAIGSSLKIPENAEAIYKQFTTDIADKMNELKSSGLNEDEMKAQLASTIKTAFAESGNELEVDESVVGLYAETLLEDFAEIDNITPEYVEEFFMVFAEVNDMDNPADESASAGTTTVLGSFRLKKDEGKKKEYTCPAYQNKTTEELKTQSAAGLLATVLQEVVTSAVVNADDEAAFQEDVKKILTESYKAYAEATGKDASKADSFAVSVKIETTTVSVQVLESTKSMQSSETLKVVTTKVTIEDLLVDSKAVASEMNAEKVANEAAAIQNIFGSAGEIMNKIDTGINGVEGIGEIAGSLGSVLDNLSGTASFGEDKTNNLLYAVMQSETVRESANLDHKTATELAKAATEKNPDGTKPNFTETMNSLASGASLADKLTKEDAKLEEADIRELLDNMTPQTAGMLKSYMTEERIRSFGIPEQQSAISTELIQNLLTEMGDKAKYQDTYDAETDGILKLFNMVSSVSKSNIQSDHLFNRGNSKGRLDATADEVVSSVLGSNMVCNAAMKTLNNHGELKVNPLGLNINENTPDYVECKTAVETYYQNHSDKDHPEKSKELRDRLDAVAALLGVTGINYNN